MKRYIRSSKSLNNKSATSVFYSMPDAIKFTAQRLSYWLGVENCGRVSTLDDAERYILDRTVNNPRSKFHVRYFDYVENGEYKTYTNEDSIAHIREFFDYCKKHDISVDQLCKIGRLVRR